MKKLSVWAELQKNVTGDYTDRVISLGAKQFLGSENEKAKHQK
jgi:hypothetical protein